MFHDANDIPTLMRMAVGAASVCWENPGGAGEFDERQANLVADSAIARLAEFGITDQPFEKELERLINRHSMENESDTPDYILADYLKGCLDLFRTIVRRRDGWHGFQPRPKRDFEVGGPGPVAAP